MQPLPNFYNLTSVSAGPFPRVLRPAFIYMHPVPFILCPMPFIGALSFSNSLVQLPMGLNCLEIAQQLSAGVVFKFFWHYKRSDWRFSACAINVKSSISSERTKHLWHKYHGLFLTMYIISQRSYLSQINMRQTSFEAYFDSRRKSRDCSVQ